MKKPFEGLFGDTCETRLLQFLLPMYGIEFDMAELTEEIGMARQSISKAMRKFSEHGMVQIRKEGRTWFYSINEESKLVKRLEDFDNSLIESMIGEEKFMEIEKTYEKSLNVIKTEIKICWPNLERRIPHLDVLSSSGSQQWWVEAKSKTESETAKPYEFKPSPQVSAWSGAS